MRSPKDTMIKMQRKFNQKVKECQNRINIKRMKYEKRVIKRWQYEGKYTTTKKLKNEKNDQR